MAALNLAGVKTWLATHQSLALAGGVAGVGAIAVVHGRSKTAAADSGSNAPATSTAAMKGGVYDSTANDVYNSIQPEIESLQAAIDQLTVNGGLADTSAALAALPVTTPSPWSQTTTQNGSPAFVTSTGQTIPIESVVPVASRPSEMTLTPTSTLGTSSMSGVVSGTSTRVSGTRLWS